MAACLGAGAHGYLIKDISVDALLQSAGLGHYMLLMNGRAQADAMFAALLTLAVIAVVIYFAIDAGLRRLLPWQPDTDPALQRSPA